MQIQITANHYLPSLVLLSVDIVEYVKHAQREGLLLTQIVPGGKMSSLFIALWSVLLFFSSSKTWLGHHSH